MYKFEVKYKDKYTRGKWAYCSGKFKSEADCIAFFGLNECEAYAIVKVTRL